MESRGSMGRRNKRGETSEILSTIKVKKLIKISKTNDEKKLQRKNSRFADIC